MDKARSFRLIGHLIERGKEQVLFPLVMMLGQALEDRLLVKEPDRAPPALDLPAAQVDQQTPTTGEKRQQAGVLAGVELFRASRNLPGAAIDGEQQLLLEPDVVTQLDFIRVETLKRAPQIILKQRLLMRKI